MFPVGGKCVVVKRELAHFGDIIDNPLDLFIDILWTAGTHFPPGECLGPEAVDAAGRAATTGVDRDIGVFEVGNHILLDRQVTPVHRRHEGQGIQVFDRRPVGRVHDAPLFHETDTVNPLPLSPFAQFLGRIIEFSPADDINDTGAGLERLLRQDRHMGPCQDGHDRRLCLFDTTGGLDIDRQGRGRGVHHHHIKVAGYVQAVIQS